MKFEMDRNMNVYNINILYNILQQGVDGIILHLKLYKSVSQRTAWKQSVLAYVDMNFKNYKIYKLENKETLVFHTIIVTVRFKIGNFAIKFKTMKYSHTVRYRRICKI